MLDALTDRLEAREVDHRIDVLRREQRLRLVLVGEVERLHRDVGARECVQTSHDSRFRIAEVVDDDDIVSSRDEMDDGVRTDVTRSTTDEDTHRATVCRWYQQPWRADPLGLTRGGSTATSHSP